MLDDDVVVSFCRCKVRAALDEMLKKINSFLVTTSTTKKQRPGVTFDDGKFSSDSAVDSGQLVNWPLVNWPWTAVS